MPSSVKVPHRVDHEVDRHQVHRLGPRAYAGHGRVPRQAAQRVQHEVHPVELVRRARLGVAHHDAWAKDEGRDLVHAVLHQHLGVVLRFLVEILEPGVVDQFVLVDGAGTLARYVGGADVPKPLQIGALREQVEHVPRALHVDLPPDLPGNGEVVHGGEVHRPRDLLGHRVVVRPEAEIRLRNVAGQHRGPVGQAPVGEQRVRAALKLRLHEEQKGPVGRRRGEATQEARPEEAGDAGEEGHGEKGRRMVVPRRTSGGHLDSSRRSADRRTGAVPQC